MREITLASLLALLLICGCKKETAIACHATTAATVYYSGPISVDGCDVLINIEGTSTYYHAINLDSIHKVTGLKIYMDYTLTGDSFGCGDFAYIYYKNIRLNCISER